MDPGKTMALDPGTNGMAPYSLNSSYSKAKLEEEIPNA